MSVESSLRPLLPVAGRSDCWLHLHLPSHRADPQHLLRKLSAASDNAAASVIMYLICKCIFDLDKLFHE